MKRTKLRQELKKHKSFFLALSDPLNCKKVLKKATEWRISLISRVLLEVAHGHIPLLRSAYSQLKDKRKFSIFSKYFGEKEAIKEAVENGEEKQILLDLAICLPSILQVLFKK